MAERTMMNGGIIVGNESLSALNLITDIERMHLPIIFVPKCVQRNEPFECSVKTGLAEHPLSDDDYIEFIEVFAEEYYILRKDMGPGETPRTIEFELRLGPGTHQLRVYQRCTVHGTWTAKADILVI